MQGPVIVIFILKDKSPLVKPCFLTCIFQYVELLLAQEGKKPKIYTASERKKDFETKSTNKKA